MTKGRLTCFLVAILLASCAHVTRQSPPGGDPVRVVGGTSVPRQDRTPSQKAGRSPRAILASLDTRPEYFNPTRSEAVEIGFILLEDAYVSVTVRDPDGAEIATIATREHLEKGRHVLKWDGRDRAGLVVPDEAYYPVVQAENGGGLAEVLDPLVDSGGISRDVTVADYSPESQTLTYSMLELGRVQIVSASQAGRCSITLLIGSRGQREK